MMEDCITAFHSCYIGAGSVAGALKAHFFRIGTVFRFVFG